jgi:hypothetical protein
MTVPSDTTSRAAISAFALQPPGTAALMVSVGIGGWLLAGQVGAVLALGA